MSWGYSAMSYTFDPPTISGATSTSCGCVSTENGALDTANDVCIDYESYPEIFCGYFDDNDFTSNDMCCECGGGTNETPSLFTYWIEPTSTIDDLIFRIGIDS